MRFEPRTMRGSFFVAHGAWCGVQGACAREGIPVLLLVTCSCGTWND